jgi:putative ABC transport system substrate-binding protein
MTARRKLLQTVCTGMLVAALPAFAQPSSRVWRIGYLSGGSSEADASWLAAFRLGMAELGWAEGRDYIIDARYANGVAKAMADLAADLLASKPNVLLTSGDGAVRVLLHLTKTLPIVFGISQDPVGSGFAERLRRPGGNTTGLTTLAPELTPKRLQLLKEAFPLVTHVVQLFEPDNVGSVSQLQEVNEAAPRLGLRVTPASLRKPVDIEVAFKQGAALGAHAYLVSAGLFTNTHLRAIVDFATRLKVPSMGAFSAYTRKGGLMSYAPSYEDNFRRAAAYVDKIFTGANPGDLPIEQPTRFEFVLNQKTAKAMGFAIPPSILLRADELIE